MNNNRIKIGLRPLTTAFIVGMLLISTLIYSVIAAEHGADETETQYAYPPWINFMQDVREALTEYIKTDPDTYWQGRAFGTIGEWYAADILKDFWDQHIAPEEDIILEAEYDYLCPEFTHKVDVENKEDYNLTIHLEDGDLNISYLEYFPSHNYSVSEDNPDDLYDFENAIVLKTPDEIYWILELILDLLELLELIQDVLELEEIVNIFEFETSNPVYSENIWGNFSRNISKNIEVLKDHLISHGHGDIISEESDFFNPSDSGNNEDSSEPSCTSELIYLIENSKCRNFSIHDTYGDYSYAAVVLFLYLFTDADAFLLADHHQDTHFMAGLPSPFSHCLPGMMINGSVGDTIIQSMEDYGECSVTADFYLKSSYIDNVESKNVIGMIPGAVDDIVVVGASYDSMWCQGAADDAGSVSVVWGIAKYIADHYDEIEPHYTLMFAAWAGEEYGLLGSKSYVSNHSDDQTFVHCINAGAFGYVNDTNIPKNDTRFHVYSLETFPEDLQDLIEEIDYTNLSDGYGGVDILGDSMMVDKTDAGSFRDHVSGGIFSFDKGDYSTATHWLHRSGEDHTKGDILEIIDETEINAAAEVLRTTVEYFATTEYVNNS